MEWIRTHGDRLLIGGAVGCIALALAVLGFAALAAAPGMTFIVTIIAAGLLLTTWLVWRIITRRVTRSHPDAPDSDRTR
jgi:Flp pilus assembly protein TadB